MQFSFKISAEVAKLETKRSHLQHHRTTLRSCTDLVASTAGRMHRKWVFRGRKTRKSSHKVRLPETRLSPFSTALFQDAHFLLFHFCNLHLVTTLNNSAMRKESSAPSPGSLFLPLQHPKVTASSHRCRRQRLREAVPKPSWAHGRGLQDWAGVARQTEPVGITIIYVFTNQEQMTRILKNWLIKLLWLASQKSAGQTSKLEIQTQFLWFWGFCFLFFVFQYWGLITLNYIRSLFSKIKK